MATLAEIRAQYPQYQDMSDEALADALHRKFYADIPRDQFFETIGVRSQSSPAQSPEVAGEVPQQPAAYGGGRFDALTEASHAGFFGGYDDEIGAGMMAPIHAGIDWFKGKGFDVGANYTRLQQEADARKESRREAYPGASITGEVAGGLALGGKLAQSGASLIGRTIPLLSKAAPRTAQTLLATTEGAAYGGLYGSGEAKPGERMEGATTGALIGGATGGAFQMAGNALANRAANKAVQAATPTSDDLASVSQGLYRASEREGVRFKAPALKNLQTNLKMAAGRINDRLRPKTAGFMDDVDALFSGDMSLEAFDEFRKSLNKELARATPDDGRTLSRMKRVVDGFADSVKPGDFTGDAAKAVDLLKQARTNWARSAKTEAIERILDRAEVDGAGKYTQSGFANAIRREMNTLYKQIQKGKAQGWTKEEIALIRQMASGGSNSKVVNLFAKLAPRGVVSFMGGQLVGSAVPGIGNVALPLAGEVAARAADRGALSAANALRTGAATGTAPRITNQVTNKTAPFIPGAVAGNTEFLRLLSGGQPSR